MLKAVLIILFAAIFYSAFSQSKINYSDFENTFEIKKSDKNSYQSSEKSTFSITKSVFNFYKKYISSQDSRHCTFYPSCSVYALHSIQKKGIIRLENITDDKLYVFYTDVKNLPILFAMGVHSRRPNINGEWLKDKKKRLAHDIIKPNNLESLNHTVKKYGVIINGREFVIEAKSRNQATYLAWKEHPDYDGKITSIKKVKVNIIMNDQCKLNEALEGE